MKKIIPQAIKNIYHLFQAILANLWFGFPASPAGRPSRKMTVIGVTGTNGKTTTIQMITRILEEAGHKVAMASTINFKIGGVEWVNKTKFTTLSAWAVQKFIHLAAKAGCRYLVLEVSSHSLDQNRIWGIAFKTGVITNITREHLDYHKNIEEYRRAKKKLFRKVKVAVVNLDMDRPEEFLDCPAEKRYGYTAEIQKEKFKFQNDFENFELVEAKSIKSGTANAEYSVNNVEFKLNLLGIFNIENALAATCVGIDEEVEMETIKRALERIRVVPGRMETVENDRNLNIIIDYAVTPDSLEKLYELIKNIRANSPDIRSDSRVISVFGACGERDQGKRPIMGKIVSSYADFVIITNEDPYGEDPMQIINGISTGIQNKTEGENFWKIFNRREAIKKALQLAETGDFVVVTGKGAEETMAVGKKRIPWNDRKAILEVLQEL